MKQVISTAVSALLLSTMFSNSVAAMSAQAPRDLVNEAFGWLPAAEVEVLDSAALDATEGKWLPLVGVIGAITTVDLALAGFFWGVYVPYYGGGTGQCFGCGELILDLD